MNTDEMNADEMITRFLKTGELPEIPIIKMPKGKATSLKNGNFNIHFRDLSDEVSKIKDNPWKKLNPEQKKLIASNTPGFAEEYNKMVFRDVLFCPEKYISLFKSKGAQKAVFEDNVREGVNFMKMVVLIYLDLILSPDKYFDSENEINKRLIAYLRAQTDFLKNLLKRINDIPQQSTSINKGKVNEKLEQFEENTTLVINALNQYNFSGFLSKNNLKSEDIYQLINKHSGRELVPYTIALLHELGYLDYYFKEYTKTRSDGFKKLGKIFDINERRIKGNINILNPKSTEDTFQYTSHKHIKEIRSRLKNYMNN